ncbi:chromate resistance protein ChrB domain-containing protein [Fibrella aquatica]|uniref:chromate resistance protein ChrB domain-containing protein n=1 Tax=Fibrella aquatica TaxID=3242487 RepID=UPI00352081FF
MNAITLLGAVETVGELVTTNPKGKTPTKWITRSRPKIDRIACPWLILRFIDQDAEITYVPKEQVFAKAKELGAIPFDIVGAEYEHAGELCTFEVFLKKHNLETPALQQLGLIVRGADTDNFELAPQAAGLWAISAGLSENYTDDQLQLAQGMIIYDALYSWATKLQKEKHTWEPKQ